jgi:hypothetical protein
MLRLVALTFWGPQIQHGNAGKVMGFVCTNPKSWVNKRSWIQKAVPIWQPSNLVHSDKYRLSDRHSLQTILDRNLLDASKTRFFRHLPGYSVSKDIGHRWQALHQLWTLESPVIVTSLFSPLLNRNNLVHNFIYTVTNTRCSIGTVFSPDDEHIVARNMYRKTLNILRKFVHQFGSIYKII